MIPKKWRLFLLSWALSCAASAAPYLWEDTVSTHLLSPADKLEVRADGTRRLRGASAQGGLVDIRYGQVSLDLGGKSLVFTIDETSILTLNGTVTSPEALLKHLPDGLAATARFDPRTGRLGWLDAYGQSSAVPRLSAVQLDIVPWKGPAYQQGERLTVSLPRREAKRLGLSKKTLRAFIPGITHDLPLLATSDGGAKATFTVMSGWDYQGVPVMIRVEESPTTERVYGGPRLSFSTTGPSILGSGPQVASGRLKSIPGWVDHRSESGLIDPSTAVLKVSEGCRVLNFSRRVDRSSFELETDGPGDYWIEFRVSDRMGRSVKERWMLRVLP